MTTTTGGAMTPDRLHEWMAEQRLDPGRAEDRAQLATDLGLDVETVEGYLAGREPIPRRVALAIEGLGACCDPYVG